MIIIPFLEGLESLIVETTVPDSKSHINVSFSLSDDDKIYIIFVISKEKDKN